MPDNLPPIPDGYELVPKEAYGILLTTKDMLYCILHQMEQMEQPRWVAVQAIDRPIMGTAFFGTIKYIRPIKTVATSPSTEPPLGLCPRNIWLSGRVKSIKEAMARYACAKKDIPYAWVEELFDLETDLSLDLSFGKEQP